MKIETSTHWQRATGAVDTVEEADLIFLPVNHSDPSSFEKVSAIIARYADEQHRHHILLEQPRNKTATQLIQGEKKKGELKCIDLLCKYQLSGWDSEKSEEWAKDFYLSDEVKKLTSAIRSLDEIYISNDQKEAKRSLEYLAEILQNKEENSLTNESFKELCSRMQGAGMRALRELKNAYSRKNFPSRQISLKISLLSKATITKKLGGKTIVILGENHVNDSIPFFQKYSRDLFDTLGKIFKYTIVRDGVAPKQSYLL